MGSSMMSLSSRASAMARSAVSSNYSSRLSSRWIRLWFRSAEMRKNSSSSTLSSSKPSSSSFSTVLERTRCIFTRCGGSMLEAHAEVTSNQTYGDEPVFPELFHSRASEPMLIGIDPDRLGAIAMLRWKDYPAILKRSNEDTHGDFVSIISPIELAASASIEIFDMPIEVWKLHRREKKHPSPESLLALFATFVADTDPDTIRAVVEFGSPSHLSGKYAWYGNGFATGLFTGLLLSKGIKYCRVQPVVWKRDMGLYGQGKEGSLHLARCLFPQVADSHLSRKKDHGRAEALLLAAWALGVRAPAIEEISNLPT